MTQLLCNTNIGERRAQRIEDTSWTIRVLLAIAAALLIFGWGVESGVCGDVQGVVSDASTGLPVPGATVILWETQDTTTTNASGEYFFASIPSGATLVIGKPGYAAGVGTATSCFCPYQCDYDADGFLTALDLGHMIDVLFAGKSDIQDLTCPTSRMDFDNDGFATALDLGKLIDHLFAGASSPLDPCSPL